MATIKKSRAARIAAGAGALALASLVALGGAAPASAAPAPFDAPLDAEGSVTIHKLEQPESLGAAGDGTEFVGGERINDVPFTIERVDGVDLRTSAGWTALGELTAAAEATDVATALGSDYDLVDFESGTTGQVAGFDGVLKFGGLELGLYVVTEQPAPGLDIAFAAEPFFVSVPFQNTDEWIYDIHVYPKNALTGVDLALDESQASILGDHLGWTITAKVPHNTEHHEIESFVISDVLPGTLSYNEDAVVTLSDGAVLTLNTADTPGDFEVSYNTTTRKLEIVFTDVTKLLAAGGSNVIVTFSTDVTDIGDGSIENRATLQVNGTAAENTFQSPERVSNWGSLEVTKVDAADAALLLDGAEFQLRSGSTTLQTLTTEDGVAFFSGIRFGAYTLVESKAPVGYVLPTTSIPGITIDGPETLTVENAKVPAYALPVTGGDGQLMFMLGGAGLVLLAVGFALVRRRKADQQA